MKFNSIITNIKIGSAITFALFILLFIAFLQHSHHEHIKQISHRYTNIQNYLEVNRLNKSDAKKHIESLNFQFEDDYKKVLKNSKYKLPRKGFELIQSNEDFYLFIHTPYFKSLFKDLNTYERNYYGHLLFALLFIVFVFMYIWIINALAPLKSLKKEMHKFANGDLNINTKSDKKDEIAQLGNEFDNAVKKISLLIKSRQLFLRTIMHELKTPIAKGRIVSELIDDEKQKSRLIIIFEKLNILIDDFAKVEQIVSNNYTPNIYRCKVDAIVNKSIEMLMLESRENISIEKNADINIDADMELISLAVKNLIDNALKYSLDAKIKIIINKNKIEFISKGSPLQKPLEEYYKPFHNDTQNKNHGMGLGLYIVHSILKMHKMSLEYKHKDNKDTFNLNIFSIVYLKH
nr:ArsS family sensor histidine kinase [uncultured Sulfurimonas sp.]